jgi:hypothetical protein
MNTRRLIVGLAALVVAISTGAFADEIYKWTDKDGNVHYEDRPSGDPSEVQLQFSYNRTNSEALQNRIEAHRDTEISRDEARAEAAEDRRTAEENRLEAEQTQAECESYRARLNQLLSAPRIYRTDEAGERVYLDEAQRAESRSRAETYIKETCDT